MSMIGALFYRMGEVLARRFPEKLSRTLTEWFVAVQYAARVRSRRVIRRNLRIVLNDTISSREVDLLTRRVFSYFGQSIYCFLRLPSIGAAELQNRCDFNGIESVVERVTKEGGCIFVGPHLGAWEVGGACLSLLGVDLVTVALPHPSKDVTRFFNERRRRMGVESTSIDDPVQPLRQALRSGKSVALLIDRVYADHAARVNWFDRDVVVPVGHAALAVRCRVPVVTTACVFDEGNGFRFLFRGPHYPRTDMTKREAMMDIQTKCIDDMTELIREYPDQWFHFHPFGSGSY